jgi:hypothetical protein
MVLIILVMLAKAMMLLRTAYIDLTVLESAGIFEA